MRTQTLLAAVILLATSGHLTTALAQDKDKKADTPQIISG
jgi:hypothetical protein